MSDHKPITKALREYIERHPTMMYAVGLTDLCDNIDAIHRSLEQENERMCKAQDDYIKLPVDADGVPIHIGDWIINPDISNQKQKVTSITPDSVYWWGEGGCHWRYSHLVRHYHPDTWESIIEDAREYELNIGGSYLWKNKSDDLVARCKTLAGEGE